MIGMDEAVLVSVIIGLVEMLKQVGLPKRLSPLVSLTLGIVAGFFYLAPGELSVGILQGIIMGLSATGLYSGTKNMVQPKGEK
ncbi:hypothetical protein SAMN05444487_11814 [Marininema mesophilum]|uniref:Phage holin family Hol44, holin superfamily V n=1 Tax=Marininema mesophilum TaxID=1048340 RepID=A0A1H3BS80_9BACL|nr:transposase [Marininema mesophilum]SDX44783.1 hypothetical protein SAMN05444487_11814 [Marininema mesophilum]